MVAEAQKIDPLRVLSLAEVCRRTGYSRSYILKKLAEDRMDSRPGRSFPAPLRRPSDRGGKPRIEWREIRIAEWLESREVMS